MERTTNKPLWDAKRLVQEYFKMASLIKSNQGKPFDDLTWSNQIRIKRIASALRAFIGLKETEENPVDLLTSIFDGWQYDRLFKLSVLMEEDYVKLMALAKEAMKDDHRYEALTRMYDSLRKSPSRIEWEKYRDRRYMLHVLQDYREKAEKLISHFGGMMEGTVGAYLRVLAVKGSCIEPLKHSNEKIDDMIVLLLGDKFKQSFSEEELKDNHGYPKETDDELEEWDCDNM